MTATPAALLGISGTKGSLDAGVDADLIVLHEETNEDGKQLIVNQVWKFGTRVFDRSHTESNKFSSR